MVVVAMAMKLLASRVGLCGPPRCLEHMEVLGTAYSSLFRLGKAMRLVHAERCPRQGPAIFVGNHIKLDDPCVTFVAGQRATNGAMNMQFMMRDDFFGATPPLLRICNVDQISRLFGALQISRGQVHYSQLRPFLDLLGEGGAFLLYIGRSRSRSGVMFEYRDDVTEPGSAAFFVTHAQRRHPDRKVAVVPVVRSLHPARKTFSIVFGESLYLEPGADRAAQRAFDREAITRTGELVEVNAGHVISLILYLRCLHGLPSSFERAALRRQVAEAFDRLQHPLVHPAARENLEGEFDCVLRYLAEQGALRAEGARIALDAAAILSAPPFDRTYRKQNPVKYIANQVLHLSGVTRPIEDLVIEELKQEAADRTDRSDQSDQSDPSTTRGGRPRCH